MNFDFSLLLVIATAVSGIIVIVDALFFAEERRARINDQETEAINILAKSKGKKVTSPDLKEIRKKNLPVLVDYSRALFPVFFLVLIVRSFFFEPYQIPSGSMLPTLRIGDFILVNKFTYGVRLPVINIKVLPGRQPKRGEVMVFKAPFEQKTSFIKRVVGLPGDTIEIRKNELFVNGTLVSQGMIFTNVNSLYRGYNVFRQEMDEKKFLVIKSEYYSTPDGAWQVPEGSYFVMGDNRGDSHDSRFWGFVPDELVVGQAVFVWMHWNSFLSIPSFSSVGSIDENL